MEFKIGDKVKIIQYNCSGVNIGDICIIEKYKDGNLYAMNKRSKEMKTSGCNCENNFELVTSNYKPKIPSHLVVWEIKGCGDPCKFFENLNEANVFVKELSEDSSVDQDSIILVEIKSSRKVTISKRLTLKEFKI